MGEPRRLNRQYDIPRKMWDKQKILSDQKLSKEFGLKTKKEIWKAETRVRNYRKLARTLLAGNVDNYQVRHDEILGKLINMGIFTKDHKLEDVLKLQSIDLLERRLQTQVLRKGLSLTADQARQLITHKHIAVNGKVRNAPSSIITINDTISYSNSKIKAVIERQSETKGKSTLKPKDDKEVVKVAETAEVKKSEGNKE